MDVDDGRGCHSERGNHCWGPHVTQMGEDANGACTSVAWGLACPCLCNGTGRPKKRRASAVMMTGSEGSNKTGHDAADGAVMRVTLTTGNGAAATSRGGKETPVVLTMAAGSAEMTMVAERQCELLATAGGSGAAAASERGLKTPSSGGSTRWWWRLGHGRGKRGAAEAVEIYRGEELGRMAWGGCAKPRTAAVVARSLG
ncbi:hypothetical protein E2562_022254 [Oryza meyeriana var. granulata]|uniref:DUF834 domain-containing protein n=1 Tax=Oryza meyeriana var. granulata TaxID=110450 RepID=A0A6G1ENY8_9ORYZ|nr:hypothetical protein E2562_022254 [Oryza meyeriana var. granulata]